MTSHPDEESSGRKLRGEGTGPQAHIVSHVHLRSESYADPEADSSASSNWVSDPEEDARHDRFDAFTEELVIGNGKSVGVQVRACRQRFRELIPTSTENEWTERIGDALLLAAGHLENLFSNLPSQKKAAEALILFWEGGAAGEEGNGKAASKPDPAKKKSSRKKSGG